MKLKKLGELGYRVRQVSNGYYDHLQANQNWLYINRYHPERGIATLPDFIGRELIKV